MWADKKVMCVCRRLSLARHACVKMNAATSYRLHGPMPTPWSDNGKPRHTNCRQSKQPPSPQTVLRSRKNVRRKHHVRKKEANVTPKEEVIAARADMQSTSAKVMRSCVLIPTSAVKLFASMSSLPGMNIIAVRD